MTDQVSNLETPLVEFVITVKGDDGENHRFPFKTADDDGVEEFVDEVAMYLRRCGSTRLTLNEKPWPGPMASWSVGEHILKELAALGVHEFEDVAEVVIR